MGLIHDAKKAGLWPPETHRQKMSERIIDGGLVIESAEGVRFAYSTIPLPRAALPEVSYVEAPPEVDLSSVEAVREDH